MKIMDNGTVRDMTEEEEKAFIDSHAGLPPEPAPEPPLEDKAEAYDILTGVSE